MPPDDTDHFPEPTPLPQGDWGSALDYDPDTVPVVHPVRKVWCWRCGETAEPVAGRCPWCNTWTDGERPEPRRTRRRPVRARPVYDDNEEEAERVEYAIPVRRPSLIPPIVIVCFSYFGLLASLVGCAIIAAIQGMTGADDIMGAQALTEGVTTGLTLVALALVWTASRQKLPEGTMGVTWVCAFPILCVLLLMNLAFFTFLRELLKPLGAVEPERMKMTLLTVLLICVQPAIVEELFFRQMTLGVLRKSVNVHLAIWLTGAVFAGAHLGNILGMPYLFLVGAFLGYARVYGGLTLAMILHFLHNFAVVAYDVWRP